MAAVLVLLVVALPPVPAQSVQEQVARDREKPCPGAGPFSTQVPSHDRLLQAVLDKIVGCLLAACQGEGTPAQGRYMRLEFGRQVGQRGGRPVRVARSARRRSGSRHP